MNTQIGPFSSDGASYYKDQSLARGLLSESAVQRESLRESIVYKRAILPFLPNSEYASIYEAATGAGILQCWLRDNGFKNVYGSDFAEKESAMACQINSNVVQADAIDDLRSRFTPASLDTILALDFYEHLSRETFRTFLALSYERLKSGGVLIMRGPNGDSPFVGLNYYNDITHVWAYTTVCLNALCHIAGYGNVVFKDDTLNSIHFGRWWKLPLMKGAQITMGLFAAAAARVRIKYWGSSLYVYAYK